MKLTLVILAAGLGSRYGGNKQTDGIGPNNEAILEYSIYDAIQAGFQKVVLVIKEEHQNRFQELFESQLKHEIDVCYVFQNIPTQIDNMIIEERTRPWGTAQAILTAQHRVHDPFIAINADDFYGRESFVVMSQFLQNQCHETHYAMVGYILQNTLSENGSVARGLCQMQAGQLVDLKEATQIVRQGQKIVCYEGQQTQSLNPNTYVSMNFWGFHPSIFERLEIGFSQFAKAHAHDLEAEYFISSEVGSILQAGKIEISVLESHAQWFGLTYQKDKQIAKKMMQTLIEQGQYPESLWKP